MSWLAWLIAGVSSIAFLVLWFHQVRQLLQTQKSTLDSAAGQLAAFRQSPRQTPPELLTRSESIYRQALDNYNRTLRRPWAYLPGRLMGFRPKHC